MVRAVRHFSQDWDRTEKYIHFLHKASPDPEIVTFFDDLPKWCLLIPLISEGVGAFCQPQFRHGSVAKPCLKAFILPDRG